MKILIFFIVWCILFVLSWPLALLALVLAPIVWLVSLPIRLVIVIVEAFFSLLSACLGLPGRLLSAVARV